jgi:hypothetical protein
MLLVSLAMAIHSLGDFNLQLPGTTWLMGILTGLAVAIARLTPPFRVKQSNTKGPEILDYAENVSKSVEKGQAQ